jgi:hypothetical protein
MGSDPAPQTSCHGRPSPRSVLGHYLPSCLPALTHRGPGKEASDGGDVGQNCVFGSGQNVCTALGRSMVSGSSGITDRALACQLVGGGELPSVGLGRCVVVPRAALLRLVACEGAGTPPG